MAVLHVKSPNGVQTDVDTEKLLLSDPVYKEMTIESKNLYRKRIVELAKKHHMHEYTYLEKIFDKKKHIGFELFKPKNNRVKVVAYILTLLIR